MSFELILGGAAALLGDALSCSLCQAGWPAACAPGTILDRVGADVLARFGGTWRRLRLAAKRHKVPIVVHAGESAGSASPTGSART